MSIKQHVVQVLALAAAGLWAIDGVARIEIRQETPEYHLQYMPLELDVRGVEKPAGLHPELYAQWAALPPEQRQQMRQQMREHWQQMPPEQREMRRPEYRERWQQMPSDERQRIREEMREQRSGYGDGRYGGRGPHR